MFLAQLRLILAYPQLEVLPASRKVAQTVKWFSVLIGWLCYFYDYFAECKIGVCERNEHSLARSILPSLGRRLLFVIPLTNIKLDLTKMKLNVGKCETVK